MRVVVPYDPVTPKTRLSSHLSLSERRAFAQAMLCDILAAIDEAGHEATVLTSQQVDAPAPVIVDKRTLSAAVNGTLARATLPVAVLMADLPLLTAETVERLVSKSGDVVVAPGLRGGTNGLVIRGEEFSVDYHGLSYLDHVDNARAAGQTVRQIDSYRLALDVDKVDDLTEVLLHSDGHANEWLRDAGFKLESSDGRSVSREQ